MITFKRLMTISGMNTTSSLFDVMSNTRKVVPVRSGDGDMPKCGEGRTANREVPGSDRRDYPRGAEDTVMIMFRRVVSGYVELVVGLASGERELKSTTYEMIVADRSLTIYI